MKKFSPFLIFSVFQECCISCISRVSKRNARGNTETEIHIHFPSISHIQGNTGKYRKYRRQNLLTNGWGKGALLRVKSKGVWWGSLLLWNWRGGLDDYCTPIEPYHIDNKSFRRIVKTALTEILTSLNVPKKVKLFKTKELENA